MTLKELARHLGLSPTTVSRALNGYPEVKETTRRRVAEAARALNYRPNTRAKSLATGQAMAIGHVIPLSSRHEMVNPIFADFIAGAGEAYARAGFDMVLSVVSDADEAQTYRDLKARGSVDGVIVHGPRAGDPRIDLLDEIGMPFLVHGRSTGTNRPYCWLDVNNRRAFQRATAFLLDLGHRRIGLLNGLEVMDFALRRRDGYERALAERGVPRDPALIRSDEMTEAYGYRSGRDLLALPAPPTAFLVSSMIAAIGLRRAIEEAGLRLGRDISVITHDDDLSYLRNGDDVPLFTATRSSVRDAGRQAAEMLLAIIAQPETAPRERLLEAELTVGQSTGPAPKGQPS
ncbi:LacI family transcriptional regulator [Rhodobacteraceae bacterium WD3A24]|nr:LacI family transcriptional regulator [Rhodobacteraceae bacterium WD3A24]